MSVSVKYIPGLGPNPCDIVIVGEAPGAEEERQGKPFVGRSGQLVTKMLEYIGMDRADVYITNVVKVRPEDNRTPNDEEIVSWRTLLAQEIEQINPKIVLTLGATATKAFLGLDARIGQVRGKIC